MGLASLLILGVASQLIAARVLQARQSVSCDFAIAANSGDTCASFAAGWGLTEDAFAKLNPGVTCPGSLKAGTDYCVIGTVSTAAPTTKPVTSTKPPTTSSQVPSTTSSKTTTTTTSGAAPGPTQPGLAADCTKFHEVVSGDQCGAIESRYGISASDFAKWNPYIDAECDNLWLGYYVCVGAPGATPPPTTTTATSPTGPSPQMPSITSSCNKFYQVKSGDGRRSIEQAQSISDSDFMAWNKAVDAQCDNLWLGYYVCVGVTGGSSPAPTTTKPANSGPTPQMPNTASNCKKFHQVVSGDGCWSIEQAAGISASDFAKWNPYVDVACDNLWLGYYVCIGV